MATPSTQQCIRPTAPTTVYDLDDDVLRETFAYLDDIELCAVADVNANFRRNARDVFSSRYKSKCYTYRFDKNDQIEPIHLQQLHSTLRHFGSVIISIEICLKYKCELSRKILESMNQYCTPKLEKLNLRYFNFTARLASDVKLLMSRLQVLELRECDWESVAAVSEMLSFCIQLETLSIGGMNLDRSFIFSPIQIAFCNLKSLTFKWCSSVTNQLIKNILKMNPKLKKIDIVGCKEITDDIIPHIVQYCPQVESLAFTYNGSEIIENAEFMKNFTALKSFRFYSFGNSAALDLRNLAAAQPPLEYLAIGAMYITRELTSSIGQFKQLKTLEFFNTALKWEMTIAEIFPNLCEIDHLILTGCCFSEDHLVDIIRCMPKLHEFECAFDLTINIDLYMKILDAVSSRIDKLSLKLKLHSRKCIDTVPSELLMANRKMVEISFY